ncbi:TPA: hypothetical protein N0F65_000943, partial [Lagenidium giganteum]
GRETERQAEAAEASDRPRDDQEQPRPRSGRQQQPSEEQPGGRGFVSTTPTAAAGRTEKNQDQHHSGDSVRNHGMYAMTTSSSTTLGGSVLTAGPTGNGLVDNVKYGNLPPLNPDDLKLPPPPPSAADKVTHHSEAISVSEVWEELKEKVREIVVGSSVSGILQAMRAFNLGVAGCMIALAVCEIIKLVADQSLFKVMSDFFSIIYTICFALLLIGYELRTNALDEMLRDSFGFMYNPYGRCLFLCLISVFPLGLLGMYGVLVSIIGFANAYFNYYVIMKHPSFTRGVPDYVPPAVDSSKSGEKPSENNTVV